MPTPINLTNHAYWNLSGDFKQATIADHQMKLNCSTYTPFDVTQIPTKEIAPVDGTVFDFVEKQRVADKERLTGAIDGGGMPGIDNAWVVDGSETFDGAMRNVAVLESDRRRMVISSSHPVVVVYTTNWLPAPEKLTSADAGGNHIQHSAICLETCNFPNAVNNTKEPGWPPK